MKYNYTTYLRIYALSFLLVLLSFLSNNSYGQVVKPFTQRTSNKAYSQYKKVGTDGKIYSLKGDFLMIGNTNLILNDYTVSGNNSNSQMKFVDVDGDPTTINSSSANLVLPSSCSEIVYAGLYWSGRMHNTTSSGYTQSFTKTNNESGTIVNLIDADLTHNTPNLLDNASATMSRGGVVNDYYGIQIVTIGDREFEFTIRNDGQIQKRERALGNPNWSNPVNLLYTLSTNTTVSYSAPTYSNQAYSNSSISKTNNGNWSYGDWTPPLSTSAANGSIQTRNGSGNAVETGAVTLQMSRVQTISGNRVYILNNPIAYTYNNQTYVISALKSFYKQEKTLVSTQSGTYSISGNGTEIQQREKTGGNWLFGNSYSIPVVISDSFTPTGQYSYSININTNLETEVTPTRYTGSVVEFQSNTNNSVTVYGPKTTTTQTSNSFILDKRVLKIKKEGEPYVTISENSANPWGMQSSTSNILFPSGAQDNMYAGYVDVTDYVREHKGGNYFIADVATSTGNGGSVGYYGGWGMVIIYADNTKEWRDITVFDGYAYVSGGASYELPLSGFRAVQNGPVKVDIGMMAGEGDRGITGDAFRIRNAANNAWVDLSHTNNTTNNFFNSSIMTDGTRNPSYLNNTGLDVVKFEIPNTNNSIITNNATSTRFQYANNGGGGQDTYSIFNIVFAVDAYIPDVEAFNRVTAINAGSPNQILNPTATQVGNLQPGDEVSFSMDIYNYGNDPINDALLNIEIPYTMKLMNGMQMVSNNATSGSNGSYNFAQPQWIDPVTQQASSTIDDFGGLVRWNLGTIPTQNPVSNFDNRIPLARLTYKLKVTDNCLVLMSSEDNCSLNPHIDGSIGGTGAISGTPFTVSLVSGHNMECNGEPQLGAVILGVQPSEEFLSNCSLNLAPESILIERFCGGDLTIDTDEVIEIYPEGTVFYSSLPTVPNPTIFNPATDEFIVNDDYTERYYYAVLPGNPLACFLNIRTKLNQIIQTPTIQNIVACKGVPYQVSPSSTTPLGLQVMYFTVDPNEVVEDGEDPTYIPITLQQVLNHWNTTGTYTYYAAYGVQNSTIPCDGVKTEFIITVNNSTINELSDDTVNVCSRKSYVYVPNFNNIPTTALVKWYYVDTQNQRHEYNNLWNNIEINNGELHIYNASLSMNAKKLILVYQDLQTCSLYEKEITIGIENCPIIGNPNIVSPKRY